MMVLNMYQKLPELTIHPLPFDSKVYGMWNFDGQFFYLKGRVSREKLRDQHSPREGLRFHCLQTPLPADYGKPLINLQHGVLPINIRNTERLVEAAIA